jgi:hypothetical protein
MADETAVRIASSLAREIEKLRSKALIISGIVTDNASNPQLALDQTAAHARASRQASPRRLESYDEVTH